MKTTFFFLILISLITPLFFSQNLSALDKIGTKQEHGGRLIGKIFDEKSGEDLIGASVYLVGTKFGSAGILKEHIPLKKFLPVCMIFVCRFWDI